MAKIADLFVELGIKGADKLGESLSEIGKDLKNISSGSLAAQDHLEKLSKMSIVLGGSIEEISRRGSALGMTLEMFHQYTGDDVKPIQEMAHALGMSVESATQLGMALSDSFAQLKLHGGKELTGLLGLDLDKIKNYKDFILAAQKAAKTNPMGRDITNQALKESGLSDQMISMIRYQGNLFPNLPSYQTLNGKESKDLAGINLKWSQLGNDLVTLEAKLSEVFGPSLVNSLTSFTNALNKFVGGIEEFKKDNPNAGKTIEDLVGTAGVTGLGSALGAGGGWLGGSAAVGGGLGFGVSLAAMAAYMSEQYSKKIGYTPNFQGLYPTFALPVVVNTTTVVDGKRQTKTSKHSFDSKGGMVNQTHGTRTQSNGG